MLNCASASLGCSVKACYRSVTKNAPGIAKFFMKAQISISVIIPLPDHRGIAVEAIKNWREKQTYPQNNFEIIVVSDGSEPSLEAEIQSYLKHQDSLLRKPGENIPSLTNFAAEKALGDLLFITEAHCLPKADCLTHITQYFDENEVDVACCSSDGINQNLLAQMEQRIFDEDFVKRSKSDAWNKITVRGFGIKRSVFLDAGGFDSSYGHFSEPVLGAHLHYLGYRMGCASEAKVSHYNNFNLKYLIPSLIEYGEDEIRYRIDGNQDYCRQYFHSSTAWEQRKASSLINLRHKLKNLLIIELSKIQLFIEQKNPEKYFHIYKRLWRHAIEYGHYQAINKYLKT
ncbi:glycosyltransferase [Limnofasciculus baicalensis]|nr:glycosyltransferase family A protein [Limnofasciculus baicalensis]